MSKKDTKSQVTVLGLDNFFPNTTLKFNAHGMEVQVSLNINLQMKKHLSPNNVFKGEKFFVYSLRKQIGSKWICAKTIQMVQDTLLKRCQILCRKAEIKVKESEIIKLEKQL
jgi:hypothetical protein